jgi:hypothetical protein
VLGASERATAAKRAKSARLAEASTT